jgi:hypothetical protein
METDENHGGDDGQDATAANGMVDEGEAAAEEDKPLAFSADEKARVEEIARLLREEEVKGVAGRMAAFARLVGLWTQ